MRIHAAAEAAIFALLAAGCEPTVNPPPALAESITARFDPLGNPPVVPTPNDLALMGGNGFLNVPDQPGDSDAQKAFNAYLRTLTGFPASSAATASFTGAIDLASVKIQTTTTPGALVIVDTSTGTLVTADQVVTSLSADGTGLAITSVRPPHGSCGLAWSATDATCVRGHQTLMNRLIV